jgi:hypothetical protein
MCGMTELADPRAALSTAAEDRFVEVSAEAFGVEKVQLLSPEHPFQTSTARRVSSISPTENEGWDCLRSTRSVTIR